MTCIVAVKYGQSVVMGADSAAGDGHGRIGLRTEPKVFRHGDRMLVGYTSSFRMGQLLRYRLTPPRYHSGTDPLEYMATDYVDAVRGVFKQYGWASTSQDHFDHGTDQGGTFLVAFCGRIFKIENDFQVAEAAEPYDAVGSGSDVAKGALYARLYHGLESDLDYLQKTAEIALEAAQAFIGSVRAPWHYETLDYVE